MRRRHPVASIFLNSLTQINLWCCVIMNLTIGLVSLCQTELTTTERFTPWNLPHCRNGGDMIPETCLTRDDCVRACVASILEMSARDVPHFFEGADVTDPDLLTRQMQEWLAGRGCVAGMIAFSGAWTLDEFLAYMRRVYPDKYYMLYCDSGGDHAVIGCGGEIVHNPAWYKVAIDGPHSAGYWIVWFIARIV